MSSFDDLTRNFRERHATIGVIGLGYVGLPLAVAFAEAGFEVLGLDSDPARVGLLNAGRSPIGELPSERLQAVGQR
ncbi:MAG: hypothetical protein H6638_14810 [Ardenticatenales bacterium]|nr:hypothetical protein [Ardenticatenales bacterium]